MAVYLSSFNDNAMSKPAQDELAAKLETLDRHQGRFRLGRSAHGSMKAPARCAIRSAARLCSAAGRRWR